MTREEAIKELSCIADEMPSMECANWIKAISMAIKALEQEPKWIPVSERLPEWGEGVLTYHEDEDEYQINWVTDDETVEWFHENPIAWMPLPKPYVPDTNIGKMSEIPTGEEVEE